MPLEQALKLFEEGVKLTSHCQKLLEKAEQKVVKLTRDAEEKIVEEPFAIQ